jgi:CubicO group peptidase (beta-lactamase class C family)
MSLPAPLDWRVAGIGPGPDVPVERRVTRENWRLYPYSRWAFQHTRELVPSRSIRRSERPRKLHYDPAELSALNFDNGEGRAISWDEFVSTSYTDAMMVLCRGSVVYETYRNGMTPETPHHCFSVTKSFVGLVAEILIATGHLDPLAPVTAHIDELARSGFAGASVRDLMDMTDGVRFEEDYANPDSDVHRYSASYWTPALAKGGARETLSRLTAREAELGTSFSYRTPVADALGWVVERATGRRLADLFAELLWQPAGCVEDGYFLVDTAGHEIAASGLNITIGDLARLALLMLDADSPVASAARDAIFAGGDPTLLAASRHAERTGGSYRSQWWVSHNPQGGISALGVYGQRVYLEPVTGLALIRFGSHPIASNAHTDVMHRNAIDALRCFLL